MGQELPALHDLAAMESVATVARGGDTDVGRGKSDYDAIVEVVIARLVGPTSALVQPRPAIQPARIQDTARPCESCPPRGGRYSHRRVWRARRVRPGRVPDAPPPRPHPEVAERSGSHTDEPAPSFAKCPSFGSASSPTAWSTP